MQRSKKTKGKIQTLKCLNTDNWVTDDNQLKDIAATHFQNIFTTTHLTSKRISNLKPLITLDDNSINQMKSFPSTDEIKLNLMRMESMKYPRPDGIQTTFYKRLWGGIK